MIIQKSVQIGCVDFHHLCFLLFSILDIRDILYVVDLSYDVVVILQPFSKLALKRLDLFLDLIRLQVEFGNMLYCPTSHRHTSFRQHPITQVATDLMRYSNPSS